MNTVVKETEIRVADLENDPAQSASRLFELLSGFFGAQCTFVAAKLDISGALAAGPLPVDVLAARVGAQTEPLKRVLRALASIGVFEEDVSGCFALTPVSDLLRSDHPQSQRDIALTMLDEWNWNTWSSLLHQVVTGENASVHALGMPMFDYLHQHPDKEKTYSGSMRSNSMWQNKAIAEAYPFGQLKTIVDVGGAHGHLLAAILEKHPGPLGILYDQPQVVEAAAAGGYLSSPALAGRISTVGGSFFENAPEGADGYLMKNVVHDWDDENCIKILSNCRAAMAKNGRILVVDSMLKGRNEPDRAKFLDLMMMVGPGGRERNEEEFRDLFARANLELKSIVETKSNVVVLELTTS